MEFANGGIVSGGDGQIKELSSEGFDESTSELGDVKQRSIHDFVRLLIRCSCCWFAVSVKLSCGDAVGGWWLLDDR